MRTIEEQTATTANNLANVDTCGFKQDLLVFSSAPAIHTWRVGDPAQQDSRGQSKPQYIGLTNCGTMDTEVYRDFGVGQPVQTGRPLDAALTDDSFFCIQTEDGLVYTRDGQFHLDAQGILVNNRGQQVLGEGGPLQVSDGAQAYIAGSGELYDGANSVGRLAVVRFEDPQTELEKLGDNAWRATGTPQAVEFPGILGGYIERSNADAITSLTDLIRQLRHYEAAQKVVLSEDATLNIAANQLGRMPQS